MLNELINQGLFTERWEVSSILEIAKILEVYTGFHEVNNRLHGFGMNSGEGRVCCPSMLDVLFVEILQLTNQFFLETTESIRG